MTLLGFKAIALPDENLSENEKFIVSNRMTLDYIISHVNEKVSAIGEYIDSPLGICEVLTPPQSYYIADASRRFSDYSGEWRNIVNGYRVTLSQPLKSERTIWMIGGCGVFGVGARDEGTI